MTSPSWPVIVSAGSPDMAVASTNSTSPPVPLTARPVATPGPRRGARCLGEEPPSTQRLPHERRVAHDGLRLARLVLTEPLHEARGHLAQELPELALEIAHARFTGVVGDDQPEDVVGHGDI